jgi:hypothetical protein
MRVYGGKWAAGQGSYAKPPRRSGLPWFPKNMRSEKGQSTVEFSLVALLFFTLLFGIIEFSNAYYTKLTLQYALAEAGRYMTTGQGYSSSNSAARGAAIHDKFCKKLIGTGVPCPPIGPDFTFTCYKDGKGAKCDPDGGNPGDTVVVTATIVKPRLTGLFGVPVTFISSTTWKNENYL